MQKNKDPKFYFIHCRNYPSTKAEIQLLPFQSQILKYRSHFSDFTVFPVSALRGTGIFELLSYLRKVHDEQLEKL